MKQLLLLFLFVVSSLAHSQGGIPTEYMNDAAIDLIHNGKKLRPKEVDDLIKKHKGHFDISTLDPEDDSDIWKKQPKLEKLPVDQNPVIDLDEVDYHSEVLTPSGIFRFNVQHPRSDNRIYTMMLSKNIHSILLAKSLLRKLGYQIPDIKYVPRVTVKFKDKAAKLHFIEYLDKEAMAGDPKSWIVEHLGDDRLLLQDLIIMDSVHTIYNLAVGVTEEMPQNRRVLSALAVPMSIVNLTESVNLFRWNAGVEKMNEQSGLKEIDLFHDQLEAFQCTWNDARWITRKIVELTEDDWSQIVESTHLPGSVKMILLQKLMSRRNSVTKLFKIDAKQLAVKNDISNGVELAEGKLTKQHWPGFASRFAYGDPESPLEASEMKSFIKSKILSSILDIGMSQINQFPFMGTDIAGVNEEIFKGHLKEAMNKSVAEQKPLEVPVKSWIFPTVRGNVILSRNLVTGTYLGTDTQNLVQLVDTVGVALGAGAFFGTMGLPTPITAYASAEALIVRSYAHLRPVTSIQKSLKYPFKNILVPLVKGDYGRKLKEAAMLRFDETTSQEVKEKKIEEILKPFKDSMEVGESILITDSLATYAGFKVAGGYKQLLRASLSLTPGHMVVSRFHIHRKSEHMFHVYKDLGHIGSYGINFALDSLIPVLKVSMKKGGGHSRTKYFRLNLNPKHPKVVENASLLRKAVVHSSTRSMEDNEDTKPFILKHSFKESNPHLSLLFWQWNKQNSSTDISIVDPYGTEKFFRRHYYGALNGKNYQSYLNAVVGHWVDLIFNKQAGLSESTGNNPGYSYKGSAKSRFLSLDQELDKDGNVIEPFIKLSRAWNGWKISRAKAEDIIRDISTKYKFEFFNAPVLNDTRSIMLYNISVNMLFYQQAIDHVLKLDESKIRRIFKFNQTHASLQDNPADEEERELTAAEIEELAAEPSPGVNRFLRFLRKHKRFDRKGKDAKANKFLLKAFAEAENRLNLKGIMELIGGEQNFYMAAKIDGFREGDENSEKGMIGNSDKNIISRPLGEYGSPNVLGPVVTYQKQTDMLDGEFSIYWLMTRML